MRASSGRYVGRRFHGIGVGVLGAEWILDLDTCRGDASGTNRVPFQLGDDTPDHGYGTTDKPAANHLTLNEVRAQGDNVITAVFSNRDGASAVLHFELRENGLHVSVTVV